MDFYKLPDTLAKEIDVFGEDVKGFASGTLNPIAFKGIRVAHGVYEQRKFDTHMLRIRCPGGAVTPAQLRQVAETSKRYGAPHFHVTTRGELQLHYVDLADLIPSIEELKSSGLSSRGGGGNTIRNVMASHDSGVRSDEVFDVAPYAFSLTTRMIEEEDSWNLPRKFKIAFSNQTDDTANATITCLGFIAKIKDGQKGFRVYVGGGMGAAPIPGVVLYDWVPDTQVYYIARAIKLMFDKHGDRRRKHQSRFKFLVKKLGVDEIRRLIEEDMKTIPKGLELTFEDWANKANDSIDLEPSPVSGPEYDLWSKRYVKAQKQDGLHMIKVPLKLGDIDNEEAIKLANFLEKLGENNIRCALDQNLYLRNIPTAYLGNLYTLITSMHTLSANPIMIGSMIACTGADTCKLGICLPRGASPMIAEKLLNSDLDLDKLDDVRLHISGCPNTCGRHHSADLGFFGKVMRVDGEMLPAYFIMAGGQVSDGGTVYAEKVSEICAKHMPDFVYDLFERYLSKIENYSSFHEYVSNGGRADIAELAGNYKELPTLAANKDYFYDWGAAEQFSLLKGQKAECCAGVFDMIDVDSKLIAAATKELDGLSDEKEINDTLYRIVFSACRMLLVTRGLEVKRDEQAFELFQQHFIESDLISNEFTAIVTAGKDGDHATLNAERDTVVALGTAIRALYKTMDDSLRFTAPEPVCEVPADDDNTPGFDDADDADVDVSKDFRGVGCPMNFVKTKIAMESMEAGQLIEILLDDGDPIQNVPGSVKLEGHEILSQDQRDDGHWALLIKKV